jgi:hypothetical protein
MDHVYYSLQLNVLLFHSVELQRNYEKTKGTCGSASSTEFRQCMQKWSNLTRDTVARPAYFQCVDGVTDIPQYNFVRYKKIGETYLEALYIIQLTIESNKTA